MSFPVVEAGAGFAAVVVSGAARSATATVADRTNEGASLGIGTPIRAGSGMGAPASVGPLSRQSVRAFAWNR